MSTYKSKYAIIGIYQIYNIVNGKVYIGKAVDIFKRKHEHFNMLEGNYHYNVHLQQSFNKYGKECFRFSIIEECDEKDLIDKEIYYIEQYDSFYSGYNQTLGGDGMSGRKWSESQRETMRIKMKGNTYGIGNSSNTGMKRNQESRDKMSKSRLGQKRGKYNKNKNDRQGVS